MQLKKTKNGVACILPCKDPKHLSKSNYLLNFFCSGEKSLKELMKHTQLENDKNVGYSNKVADMENKYFKTRVLCMKK